MATGRLTAPRIGAQNENKDEALVVARTIRFTRNQLKFLQEVQRVTGCGMAEYIRRLVDANRAERKI